MFLESRVSEFLLLFRLITVCHDAEKYNIELNEIFHLRNQSVSNYRPENGMHVILTLINYTLGIALHVYMLFNEWPHGDWNK